MNKNKLELLIEKSCKKFYKEMPDLINSNAHERTIVSHLSNYLKTFFKNWDVDTEYNREGKEGKSKREANGRLIVPDIIIHTRGKIRGPNMVAIQVKGYWNKEDRGKDEKDLIELRKKYGYYALYRLELNSDSFEIIEVN